jgi:pimeloyl-ACP methyl ester carboxylesterase
MRWSEQSGPGNGVRLHVSRVVDPPAPPVLLLHGLGVSGSVFQAFARRLLPHLAAVAPDLRGHGQSDKPSSGYAPADYALDLVSLVEDQLPPPLPVVGHSLGALVGLKLAELHPELVSWLVLLDPPLDPDNRNPEVPTVYRLRHAPPGELEAYLLDRNPGGGKLLADLLARLFRQASDGPFEAMLSAPTSAVKPLETRVLLVQADTAKGGVLGDAAAHAAVATLGNAELVKISGATHSVHASHPAEVADAILRFAGYSSRS